MNDQKTMKTKRRAWGIALGSLLWFLAGDAARGTGVWTGAPSPDCIPAPADYDGDGDTDLSQKCGGGWLFYDDHGTLIKGIWTGGVPGDLPAPADYDGDGAADVVVFRGGAWLFFDYASGAPGRGVWTGNTGIPLPMDYNGDRRADFTVFQSGAWLFYNGDGTPYKGIWTGGVSGDIPVPGDYRGMQRDEVVIFRGGAWIFFNLATGASEAGVWTGTPSHLGRPLQPAPLDYDGDGTVDFTVYGGGPWYFFRDDGSVLRNVWTGGIAGDKPLSRRQLP